MKPSLLTALLVFCIAAFLLWLSTGHESQEAYLFPMIISIAMFLLSGFLFIRELLGFHSGELESVPILRLLPALVLFVAYVSVVEYLGMYSSSVIALFLISFIYHPTDNLAERLKSSALVSVGFIGVMYILFSVLLKVQTPRGLFI